MDQIATLTKSLDSEKAKSSALQAEKKREMQSFLGGIKNYVDSLDGVKNPESKAKFLAGIENMANHGIPNGVFDIVVSASAQNEHNMRTIEALTKGYTEIKERYEGSGSFTSESSRFVDPTVRIVAAGNKRKTAETEEGRMAKDPWYSFSEDVSKLCYADQADLLGPH